MIMIDNVFTKITHLQNEIWFYYSSNTFHYTLRQLHVFYFTVIVDVLIFI